MQLEDNELAQNLC